MLVRKQSGKWLLIALLVLAFIPIVITGYEVITTNNNSVNFLGSYNPGIRFLIILFYSLLLSTGLYWLIRQIIAIAQLKNERTKAELMLLKNQMAPHFFFNMLNNLYGLIEKDPKLAQQLVLKLSDLMRYSIYDSGKETVTLEQEIDFLQRYIELHQMRYHKKIRVDFNYSGDQSQKVVPLLFIIFLENAFKHGVESLRENAYIKIKLNSTEDQINFSVENNFEYSGNPAGIGLKNLKRRLELTYQDRHEISNTTIGNIYHAKLILKNYDKVPDR